MTWAQPLGEHFGWNLWIGSAPSRRGDQFCILLTADSLTRSQCASGEWDAEGDLVVSLPYALIPEEHRPPGDDRRPERRVRLGSRRHRHGSGGAGRARLIGLGPSAAASTTIVSLWFRPRVCSHSSSQPSC